MGSVLVCSTNLFVGGCEHQAREIVMSVLESMCFLLFMLCSWFMCYRDNVNPVHQSVPESDDLQEEGLVAPMFLEV